MTNNRDTPAVIHINDTYALTVMPHDQAVVIEMLVGVPMPWHFAVTDERTGETLYSSVMSGPLGHEITLEPSLPTAAPTERPLGGCLQ